MSTRVFYGVVCRYASRPGSAWTYLSKLGPLSEDEAKLWLVHYAANPPSLPTEFRVARVTKTRTIEVLED